MVTDGTTFQEGEAFGDFFVERLLRADALTETYLARCEGRAVALKCRDLGRAAAPPTPEAFAAGVSRLRGLRDEGIPAVIDGGILDGVAWLATEHVEGNTLRDILHSVPAHMYTYLLGQALEWAVTIQTAHGAGFKHGNLRPESIVFDTSGDEPGTRIVDIGCADLFGMTPEIAAHTPLYRAPEQLGGGKVDARADIYSFGMIIYEMLALRPPFSGRGGAMPNLLKLRTMALQEMPTPLPKVHRVFPKFVADLVWKAIAKDPQERFQLMAELIEALEDASERIEPWAKVYEDGSKIPAAERARIRREIEKLPARAAQSGHRLARGVRFGLEGYEAPPLDPAGDTDPAGPPESDAPPAKKDAAQEEEAQDKKVQSGGAQGGQARDASRRGSALSLRLEEAGLDCLGPTLGEEERGSEKACPGDAPPEGAPLLGEPAEAPLLGEPEDASLPGEPEEAPRTLRAAPQTPSESAELRSHLRAPGRLQRVLLAQPAAVVLLLAAAAGLSMDFASHRSSPRARPPVLVAALRTLSRPVIAEPDADAAAQPMASKEAKGANNTAGAQSPAGAASVSRPVAAAPAPARARATRAAAPATPLLSTTTPGSPAADATEAAPVALSHEKLEGSWLAKRWSRGLAQEGSPPRTTQ
jgi:hypothetical protein